MFSIYDASAVKTSQVTFPDDAPYFLETDNVACVTLKCSNDIGLCDHFYSMGRWGTSGHGALLDTEH
jgi:hypothetical protein